MTLDFAVFDRVAQTVAAPALASTDEIQTNLDAVQLRHQQRLAKLKADYDKQTAQIQQALGNG